MVLGESPRQLSKPAYETPHLPTGDISVGPFKGEIVRHIFDDPSPPKRGEPLIRFPNPFQFYAENGEVWYETNVQTFNSMKTPGGALWSQWTGNPIKVRLGDIPRIDHFHYIERKRKQQTEQSSKAVMETAQAAFEELVAAIEKRGH